MRALAAQVKILCKENHLYANSFEEHGWNPVFGGRNWNAGEVIESALDFQTAYSIIWPQQTRLYQSGDSVNVDSVGTFNIFLDALVSCRPMKFRCIL